MELKVPPHNIEAEEALLGAMFLNAKIKPRVSQLLSSDDLYREANQYIFTALIDTESDIIAVTSNLEKKGLLEKSGGPDYVAALVECIATSAGFKFHCATIKELSVRRKIINLCATTMETAFQAWEETEEILENHKFGLRELQSDQQPDYTPNNALITTVFKDIEERKKSGNPFVGVKTGLENIDDHLSGLEAKTTTYLIARPSMGKTALALNIADSVSLSYSKKVLFFSLESGNIPLTRRRLAAHSRVNLTRLRTGGVEDDQWEDLVKAANVLSDSNLIILDRPKYKTVENLCSMAETLALEYPISLIVVDHIQRMRSKKKFNNRHLEISYISEELTTLCNEVNIPGLIICQLNREAEKRYDKRPRLIDIRESGDIEQNADVVLGLHREDKEVQYAELECLKGRDIGTWKSWLRFDRFIQKFYDCADQEGSVAGVYE